jgi:ubiquitin-conjugating enzyme E2 R
MAAAALKLLQNQFKKLQQEPVEGLACELPDDSNMFEWKFYMEGPKETCYEGGIFQLIMAFPQDYPMSPPTLRFTSEFWHPNIYPDGRVCISILHPPGVDEMSGERPEERWLPTQTPGTVMLSVLSLLSDPNYSSPANVDASVEMRKDIEAFKKRVRRLVEKSLREVPSRIKIPHPDTDPAERQKAMDKLKQSQEINFDEPFEDVDDDFDDYNEEDMDEDFEEEDGGEEEEEEEEEEAPKKGKQPEKPKVSPSPEGQPGKVKA